MKRHADNVHKTRTIWYRCAQQGCAYTSDQMSDIPQHERFAHDIWDNICDSCCFEKPVSTKYEICNDCLYVDDN